MKLLSLALIGLTLLSSASAVKHKRQHSLQSFVEKKKSLSGDRPQSPKHTEAPAYTHARARHGQKPNNPFTPHNNLSSRVETSQCAYDVSYDHHSVDDLNMDQDLLAMYAEELFDYYKCCNGVLYTCYLIDIIAYNGGWAQISPPTMENLCQELQWWDDDGNYSLTQDEFTDKLSQFVSEVADGQHPGQNGGFNYQGYTVQEVYEDEQLAQDLAMQAFDAFDEGNHLLEFWPTFDIIQYNCGWAGIGHTSYSETDWILQNYGTDWALNQEQYTQVFMDFLAMAVGDCPE